MAPRLLGDIQTSDLIARRSDLAVFQEALIDNSIHPEGEILKRGEVLAKAQTGGKFRAYAEGLVSVGFATNSKAFTVDPTERAAANFKSGDVIEKVSDSTELGTIDTFDPVTGAGTLLANAASALAAGQRCRLKKANYALDKSQGLILQDTVIMEDSDSPVSGLREGFVVKSRTSLTASAISELGAVEETSDEVRIQ